MTKQPLKILAFCAACVVAGAQAQSSTEPSSGSMPGSSGSSSESRYGHQMGMTHKEVRLSQLNGATINSSSGETLGKIEDCIVNPSSGRLDFAVISLSGTSRTTSPGTSPESTRPMTSSKQVAVPWMLLRPSSATSSGTETSGTATSSSQPSFVYAGDTAKLEAAPAFDPSADLSQSSWRHSIFSYFGVTPGMATGGGESPGSSSSGGSKNPGNP